MQGSKTNYFKQVLMDLVNGVADWTPPANVWLAASLDVFSLEATGSAMNEVSPTDTGYARVELANDSTTWSAAALATDVTSASLIDFVFPTATAEWGLVKSLYLCDAGTDGNALWGVNLPSPVDVASGGAPVVPAGLWTFVDPADPATLD